MPSDDVLVADAAGDRGAELHHGQPAAEARAGDADAVVGARAGEARRVRAVAVLVRPAGRPRRPRRRSRSCRRTRGCRRRRRCRARPRSPRRRCVRSQARGKPWRAELPTGSACPPGTPVVNSVSGGDQRRVVRRAAQVALPLHRHAAHRRVAPQAGDRRRGAAHRRDPQLGHAAPRAAHAGARQHGLQRRRRPGGRRLLEGHQVAAGRPRRVRRAPRRRSTASAASTAPLNHPRGHA